MDGVDHTGTNRYLLPIVKKEDNLPYPWVYYSQISAFVTFSETENGPRYLCECYRETLEKFECLKKIARMKGLDDTLEWIVPEHSGFKKGLCHRCNHATPTVELNYSGYSKFMTKYSWYVRKKYIDLGYMSNSVILDCFPKELMEMVAELDFYNKIWDRETKKWSKGLEYNGELREFADKQGSKIARRFHNIVENMVRDEFSYKRIGEHWTTETKLYHLVKQEFPNENVISHSRPELLEGLELDIFIPEKKLGIEYQGIQHFKAIEFWGGENALKKTQEHDKRKKALCDLHGIDLVYFYYSDDICEKAIRDRLTRYL